MANIEFFEDLALNQAETLHPVSRKILHFMGEVQGEEFDWKEEWHRHLDEKYNGPILLGSDAKNPDSPSRNWL
jgi:hypothetical protein